MFSLENTPNPSASPLVIRHPSPSPLAPPSTALQHLSSSAYTPTVNGRPTSIRGILQSINKESECGNTGMTPTLAHYLNDIDGSSGSAPIVTQQHSNEGVQMTGGGAPVTDAVLELVIAIQALGVVGQADLVRFLIRQYCVVLIGTVTRCVGSTKARRRISYERKESSSSPLSSPIRPSASPSSWMSGRSNPTQCSHSVPRVWQHAGERKVQRMVGMRVRHCGRASVRSWRIRWVPIGS